jgi:DMSO reductase family type II enzyme chaperone
MRVNTLSGSPGAEHMDNVANGAQMRAGVYDLLATMFREPLPAATLRSLRDPAMLQGLNEAGMTLDEAFCNDDEAQLQETLAVDYTQLFHGPRNHHPPYESVQTGGEEAELNGDATREVRRFFDAAGLAFDKECRELADHLSVELACMAELAGREAAAREAGDAVQAERRVEEQTTFLDRHLGRWAPAFGKLVEEHAETSFYRQAGRLLAGFIESELATLQADRQPLPGREAVA